MGNPQKIAVIDLGTNTFHLLIATIEEGKIHPIHKEKIPVKIGEGGIDSGIITEIALNRGIETLNYFKSIAEDHSVSKVWATATSAFRSAKNQTELKEAILLKTGIEIDIIDGEEEAQLIYEGVKHAVHLTEEKHLIMDIGGGSVEFIICNNKTVFWKQSYEIGGQRLMNKFHQHDPIQKSDILELQNYLANQLSSLKAACEQFSPKILVGASGSFDTLCEIYYQKHNVTIDLEKRTEYKLPFEVFHDIVKEIVEKDLNGRLNISGMIEMRANMIVVACLLIEFVIDTYGIEKITSSTYALKEGLIFRKA